MSQATTIAIPTRRVRYRWRLLFAVFLGVVIALAAGDWYLFWAEERDFQEALAETDRLDPGWRLDDIEKACPVIPEEENAALVVLKIHADTGGAYLGERLENGITGVRPLNAPSQPEAIDALQKYVSEHAEALALAARLADLPRGRYRNRYDPAKPGSENRLQTMRLAAHFLELYTHLVAEHGDDMLAGRICRSGINAARSGGDEGTLLALLIRCAMLETATASVERVLARTAPAPAELQKLQELLQQEIEAPRLTTAMRGERAIGTDMLQAVREGRLDRPLSRRERDGRAG
jgi:hypothetical protein